MVQNRRTALSSGTKTIEPIGKKAGQNKTEPKESRQLKAFCPLRSFIGESDDDFHP
ncbi:hypothetical protein [Ensifer adhaerens]|jgi:hypothetical protein|uniref:Uncharacterized protein n=1 Tax=Ensifer adhaerens TaxID=106592 RepID=A0A9Q8YDX2_ENSAD|nr:hypothetical protein [Ensifer adhaerens]USJ27450.1 hypothetical protein NE863_33985 [Ensifer adhaerens]